MRIAVLIGIFAQISCSYAAKPLSLQRVSEYLEIPLSDNSQIVEFYSPVREYNTRWVAKIRLPDDADSISAVTNSISGKLTMNSINSDPLSAKVSWWKSEPAFIEKKYMSSRNAVVNVVLTRKDGITELYAYWVAP
jgi:hypothetical protein